MPTVLREAGFRFVIYTDDHDPAHVHIYRGQGSREVAKIDLKEVSLIRSKGFSESEVRRIVSIVSIVQRHRELLLGKWMEMHGS